MNLHPNPIMNNMNNNNMQIINNLNMQNMQFPQMPNMNYNMMNFNMVPQLNNNSITDIMNAQKKIKLNQIKNIESMTPIKYDKNKYSDKDFDEITQACMTAIKEQDKIKNITNFCVTKIKEKLKGEWFVLIQDINENNLEFGFSKKINFYDTIIFRYSDKIFYVSKLNYQ